MIFPHHFSVEAYVVLILWGCTTSAHPLGGWTSQVGNGSRLSYHKNIWSAALNMINIVGPWVQIGSNWYTVYIHVLAFPEDRQKMIPLKMVLAHSLRYHLHELQPHGFASVRVLALFQKELAAVQPPIDPP